MLKRVAFAVFAGLSLASVSYAEETPTPAETPTVRTVRLGVMSFRGQNGFTTHIADEDRLLAQVPHWIASHVPGIRLETRYYRMNDLMRAIEAKDVDVFLGSSGLFWQMKHTGARDLATIVSSQTPDPNEGVAGVIFVRKDRADLNTLEDLKGKSASMGLDNMFLATQLSMAAVAKAGFDPRRFFSYINHYDLPVPKTVEDVVNGTVDVGILRACVLESEFPDWKKHLKIINAQTSGTFHCARSTDAYPNWTMAAVSGFVPELSRALAVALLTMPPTDSGAYHWSLATDFEHVDNVSRLLKTDGYAYLNEWTFARLWQEYREILIFVLFLIVGFLIHVWRVEKLVDRRTSELRTEMQRREASEASLREFEQRLDSTRKMSIVSEMSSVIAHEIRQPLASVQYLADGIRVLLRRGTSDTDKMQRCADGICRQVERINAVVDHVRTYAKEEQKRDERIDFSALVTRVVGKLRERMAIPPTANLVSDLAVKGDSLELELAVANLLKNAREAAGDTGRVSVDLNREGFSAVLTIENSGRVLTEEDFKRLAHPLASGKKTGLGLGLPIVRSITEAHRGNLTLIPRPSGGVIAVLKLPLWETTK